MFDTYKSDIDFYNDNFYLLGFIQMMYLPTVYFLYYYMKEREAINCKIYMGIWNLILCIFSSYCFYYISNPILHSGHNVHNSICTDVLAYENPSLNRWRSLFVLSKFPEMIDTVWIIIRKRKLTILQVWHHFSVCLYCWLVTVDGNPNGRGHGTYFAALNSYVHVLMYGYYSVVSLTSFRNNELAKTITQLQTIQMFMGIVILLYKTSHCGDITSVYETTFSYIMYCSYLYLFLEYYVYRYFTKDEIKLH